MENRAKLQGGIGALLIVLSFIPYIGILFALVGLILLYLSI